jgi:addiction module HigA family antidote
MAKKLDLIAPGEILLEEFMRPMGISQNRLARDVDVPPARINDIIHGRRAITADTALRLAKYFGTSAELWIGPRSVAMITHSWVSMFCRNSGIVHPP